MNEATEGTIHEVKTLEIPRAHDARGSLCVLEQGAAALPFEIRRVFYIYGVPEGCGRGEHAHKHSSRILIALGGSAKVRVKDGEREATYQLCDPAHGLFIPPAIWVSMEDFAPGTTLLVLSDDTYDEQEYIRDYTEFLNHKQKG